MASPKNINNSDIGMYSIPDSFKLRNDDDERRNTRFHMLLATMYDFNNSHMKMIHVGLQRTNKEIVKPFVKLGGHNADEIYFDTDC